LLLYTDRIQSAMQADSLRAGIRMEKCTAGSPIVEVFTKGFSLR
jgi:hypothetical protein